MGFIWDPKEIEMRSFAMISNLVADKQILPENINVVKRVIHTTADFDYADNLVFSENAVAQAKVALSSGANIVTDTQMIKAGINKKILGKLNCSIHCFIDSDEVAEAAREKNSTRASSAVEYAQEHLDDPLIFIVGNAPTALLRLYELVIQERCKPAFIIGVPVGFVNVTEAKELITRLHIPHIVSMGRKGGSNVAAAICNSLIYEIMSD